MQRAKPAPVSVSVQRHQAAWRELSSILLLLRGFQKELKKVATEHKEAPLRRCETYNWLVDVVEPIGARGLSDIIETFAVVPSPETTEVQVMLTTLQCHIEQVPKDFSHSLEHHLEIMLELTTTLCRVAEGEPVNPRLPAA